MRILLAAVEMTPFVKVGGVADVIHHWAKALTERGHEVTVALPTVAPHAPPPPDWLDLQVFHIEGFSPRDPYANEEDYQGLHVHRLHALAQAVIALCEERAAAGRPFDILHVNEWPVALLPFLLLQQRLRFSRPRTVLTIHGVIYRGVLPAWAFERFRVNPFGPPRIVDQRGLIRPLAAGIQSADVVAAPSPTYAREIVDPERRTILGQDIFEALQSRAHEIRGILHGLDRELWNPATDPHLPCHYDVGDLAGKARCKAHLETELGLGGEGGPLVLSAGRLCAAKGTDRLVELLPVLCRRGVRVVIAGTGEPAYEQAVRNAVAQQPRHLATYVGWADAAMMRRLYSAADIFVMPSLHEACGLTQMEAQRYGTVPVVRRCGGLADTVVGHTPGSVASTGFVFDAASVSDFGAAVDEALALLSTPAFDSLRRRCMDAPPTWEVAAEKYEYLYGQALGQAKEPR